MPTLTIFKHRSRSISPTPLTILPPEVLLRIFSYLPPLSLLNLRHTSHTLNVLSTHILLTRVLPLLSIHVTTAQEGRSVSTSEFVFNSCDPDTLVCVFIAHNHVEGKRYYWDWRTVQDPKVISLTISKREKPLKRKTEKKMENGTSSVRRRATVSNTSSTTTLNALPRAVRRASTLPSKRQVSHSSHSHSPNLLTKPRTLFIAEPGLHYFSGPTRRLGLRHLIQKECGWNMIYTVSKSREELELSAEQNREEGRIHLRTESEGRDRTKGERWITPMMLRIRLGAVIGMANQTN